MGLTSGAKLGPYEILSPLGAGGMGEVYRARDTRLGRDVALKVLPQALASDAERMARFQREAQVLASLNHPSIAAIYGLVDAAEESGPPAALLPDNQVAFIAGTDSSKAIAIASAGDGKIIRHIEAVKGEDVENLAASPDGNTLYYAMEGNVWAIPAADGSPRKLCAGDGVASTAEFYGRHIAFRVEQGWPHPGLR